MNIKTMADDVIHAVRDFVTRAVGPLEARLAALEARPAPERGEKGEPGTAGRDGLDGKDGAPGRDGVDGKDGAPGQAGADGRDGADGKSVTLEDVRGYLDTEVATWALAFERRAQDVLQKVADRIPAPRDGRDGKDGRDGADGFSLDDMQLEQRDERTLVLRFARGELVREHVLRLGHPLDQGVFREGEAYRRGDGVTFGGSWWIAQKDAPEGKPGLSSDWRLAVKKGRDGKDWSRQP
jgi:hypothetical protein